MTLSDRNLASLFMDGAAIFLLVGMIVNTTIYRKRGNTTDKLFFSILICNIVNAACDIAVAIANGESFPGAKPINLIGESLYYITMGIYAEILVLYQVHRLHRDLARTRKVSHIIMIPIIVVELMYLIGVPNGLFITVDEENYYHFADYYFVPIGILSCYVLAALVLMFVYKFTVPEGKKMPIWPYMIPIAGMFLPYAFDIAACQPIMMAVTLAYIHMWFMNETFFEGLDDKKPAGSAASKKGGAVS